MIFKYLFKFKNNFHGTNDFMLTTYCICRKKYIALKEKCNLEFLAHERLTTIFFNETKKFTFAGSLPSTA